jgi:chromosome segregation ATPase
LRKENNSPGLQGANQARKISAATPSGTVESPAPDKRSQNGINRRITIGDPHNIIQQLHRYVDRVEGELLNATDETMQLREMVEEKCTLIQTLESQIQTSAGRAAKVEQQLKEDLAAMNKASMNLRVQIQTSAERAAMVEQQLKEDLAAMDKASTNLRVQIHISNERAAKAEVQLKEALAEKEVREAEHQKRVESMQAMVRASRKDYDGIVGELLSVKEEMRARETKARKMESDLFASKIEREMIEKDLQGREQLRAEMATKHQSDLDRWNTLLQKSKDELRSTTEKLDTVQKERDSSQENLTSTKRQLERELQIQYQLEAQYLNFERTREVLATDYKRLEQKTRKSEDSIQNGNTTQFGSVLLVPLQSPGWLDEHINRPPVFQAVIAPGTPEGWVSQWDGESLWFPNFVFIKYQPQT